MKDIKIICDFREDFEPTEKSGTFNDHPTRKSVEEICETINTTQYNCEIFGGVNHLIDAYRSNRDISNFLFINMSDGLTQPYSRIQVPMLCELLKANYSGSPIFTVALMNNKHYCKSAVAELGIKVPHGVLINTLNFDSSCLQNIIRNMVFPLIVKPNEEGSSMGITDKSVCNDIQQLQAAIYAIKEYEQIIIEEYISGYEITNLIIGNSNDYRFNEVILTSVKNRIILTKEVLGFNEKSQKLRMQYSAHNFINPDLYLEIQMKSIKIFEHLGARDVVRIDYRVTTSGEVYFLEANSVPRISNTSECSIICQHYSISFKDIILEYIDSINKRISNREKK